MNISNLTLQLASQYLSQALTFYLQKNLTDVQFLSHLRFGITEIETELDARRARLEQQIKETDLFQVSLSTSDTNDAK